MLQMHFSQDIPTISTEVLDNYLGDFDLGDSRVLLIVTSLYLLCGRRDNEEIFLPPSNNIPSCGQKVPGCTIDSVGAALFPPFKALDGFPESFQGQ